MPLPSHSWLSRREMLTKAGAGFGSLALAWMLEREAKAAPAVVNPLAPKPAHIRGKAKSVIFLFMDGGPSHIDTFDPKPEVNRLAGQKLPSHIKASFTAMGVSRNPILASKRKWTNYGQSGIPVSDWMPETGKCADRLCVLRSMWADGINHVGSVSQMNTGAVLAGRASMGSWVTYGLGSANEDLPAFVVMLDNEAEPPGGPRNWGTGFIPATYQGTRFLNGPSPVLNLQPPAGVTDVRQREKLDLLNELNRRHARERGYNSDLEGRIAAYELSYRMQAAAPEAVDLARESAETKALYGLDRKETESFGRLCLLARRMVERGVRFIQLYSGSGSKWDAHTKIEDNHTKNCLSCDKPIAGLITDLARRGMLDDTLVIWGGEFGRTPMSEKGDGRDHNPYGFSMFLAGGGVRGGSIVGATDECGMHAIEDRMHVHDLHATILHLVGLDHERLTYPHNGLDERLTMNKGQVMKKILA